MIAKTIESLQQQDYNDYEILVIDDGSTDDTEQVVQEMIDSRTTYFNEQQFTGGNFCFS